jgi:hypothetical protein
MEICRMNRPLDPDRTNLSLHALAVAVWGACLGFWLLAVVLAPLGRPNEAAQSAEQELSWLTGFYPVPPWQITLQKWMYVAQCVACPLLAWLALRVGRRFAGIACAVAVGLFIPAIAYTYRGVFDGRPNILAFVGAALALTIPWLHRLVRRRNDAPPESPLHDVGKQPACTSMQAIGGAVVLVAALVFLLVPRDVPAYADTLAGETHLASYCFGPALALRDPAKVPGLDFESHYGVGHVYCFSFLGGTDYHAMLCHYVWFVIAVLMVYFLGMYGMLLDCLRSPRAALLGCAVFLTVSMEGLSYRWPSAWPVRFPLLFPFIGLASRSELCGRQWLAVIAAGACAGLAFFWQTDVGLAFAVAGTLYYAALTVRQRAGQARGPLFLASTGATIVLAMAIAFGPRTLSVQFYGRLLEPIFEYASGFGWAAMRWGFGWGYLYNVVAPLVALATIGLCLARVRPGTERPNRHVGMLLIASLLGMLMLFKWVNRALDNAWWMNAPALLLVLFWWLRAAVSPLAEYLQSRQPAIARRLGDVRPATLAGTLISASVLGVVIVASLFHNPHGLSGYSTSPLVRMTEFTRGMPTYANGVLAMVGKVKTPDELTVPIDRADLELIRRHSSPDTAVALLSLHDWVYLAEARRVPTFFWVPVCYTHTHANIERVSANLRQAPQVFVERNTLQQLRKLQPVLHDRLTSTLREYFLRYDDSGAALDRYVRKTVVAADTALK